VSNFLVVGGSSGIGKEIAQMLSNEHVVYATYKNNMLEATRIHYFRYDIQDELVVSMLPETIDGFCYCPGSIVLKPFSRFTPEQFIDDYRLQLVGAVKTLQSILPRLKAAGNASVVLFSTVAVQTGFNYHSLVSASKGAVEGLTRALAAEFAPIIRVNCIAPSITQTPLAYSLLNTAEKSESNANRHPLKRIGRAADIAELATFLLSDKSTWITGQILHIDGGISTLKI